MLLILWLHLLIVQVLCNDGKDTKPYVVYPLPLEMPNRNDRSDQCWVRVEDVELTQMITVYCYIAQEFLRDYIHEYNTRKMTEDQVYVSSWKEERRDPGKLLPPKSEPNSTIDWKATTIMDTITHMRIYVTLHADCRLIMYSREGTSNYKVDCGRLLYYMNIRTSNHTSVIYSKLSWIVTAAIFIWSVSL